MDIKYTDTGDIDLSSGDIRYVEPSEQHKLTILLSNMGEIITRTDLGVGAMNYLLDNDPGELLREARRQCRRVGLNITKVFFEDNKINIIGGYETNN